MFLLRRAFYNLLLFFLFLSYLFPFILYLLFWPMNRLVLTTLFSKSIIVTSPDGGTADKELENQQEVRHTQIRVLRAIKLILSQYALRYMWVVSLSVRAFYFLTSELVPDFVLTVIITIIIIAYIITLIFLIITMLYHIYSDVTNCLTMYCVWTASVV
jgi:hypothetical protein